MSKTSNTKLFSIDSRILNRFHYIDFFLYPQKISITQRFFEEKKTIGMEYIKVTGNVFLGSSYSVIDVFCWVTYFSSKEVNSLVLILFCLCVTVPLIKLLQRLCYLTCLEICTNIFLSYTAFTITLLFALKLNDKRNSSLW